MVDTEFLNIIFEIYQRTFLNKMFTLYEITESLGFWNWNSKKPILYYIAEIVVD